MGWDGMERGRREKRGWKAMKSKEKRGWKEEEGGSERGDEKREKVKRE